MSRLKPLACLLIGTCFLHSNCVDKWTWLIALFDTAHVTVANHGGIVGSRQPSLQVWCRRVTPWLHILCGSSICHDDVIKWKHFPRYWLFVRGIHRFPVNSPYKGQSRGALMFSLIWARINGWVNNGEAGDLRRNRAHYDVTVMHVFRIHIIIYPIIYGQVLVVLGFVAII